MVYNYGFFHVPNPTERQMQPEADHPLPDTADTVGESLAGKDTGSRFLILGNGKRIDLRPSRWAGILTAAEIAACRAAKVPLAYDCAQLGWVPADCRQEELELVKGAAQPSRQPTTGDPAAWLAAWRLRLGAGLSRDTLQRLRRLATAELAELAVCHGLRAADECHVAVGAALASAAARSKPAVDEAMAAAPSSEFRFRPWSSSDTTVYRSLLDDAELWRYLPEPYPAPVTEELARQLIELGTIDQKQETSAVEWNGQPVGQCMLRHAEPAHGVRSAEVAYWLGRPHWGKGWMTRILRQFVQQTFQRGGPDVLYAWIHREHAASAQVAQRCGFRRDEFPCEAELAAALKKADFQRYVACRADWSA